MKVPCIEILSSDAERWPLVLVSRNEIIAMANNYGAM